MFTTDYQAIKRQVEAIDPILYGKTRNYLNGAVSRLSPYIARGVISTRWVAQQMLAKGYKTYEIESFLKELAWRDYFQQVWVTLGDDINQNIKKPQFNINNYLISKALVEAQTGIEAIDQAITDLYATGYMHNHARMYTAAVACNIARSHWAMPARWLYYHLLDADWASNTCSWQWVAGSFSDKQYVANQENINRYAGTNQQGTWLDIDYGAFDKLPIPTVLQDTQNLIFSTQLPDKQVITFQENLPTYLYNFYNLDPEWDAEVKANRVLLLAPSFFNKYPVSPKTIQFILQLAQNIEAIQVYVGEFYELQEEYGLTTVHFKEHPSNRYYQGIEHSRTWMFPAVTGYFPSFFAYWKRCEKQLERLNN